MAWTWAYFHPAFLSLRCKYKDWTIKSLPWKQVRLSRYGQNVWKINGKEIEYPWMKENLIAPQQKGHRIIVCILCDMGLPCSKLNNSNLIKDRNIIFAASKRYINIFNTKWISKHIHIKKYQTILKYCRNNKKREKLTLSASFHVLFSRTFRYVDRKSCSIFWQNF